jgi:hypothetical protein
MLNARFVKRAFQLVKPFQIVRVSLNKFYL